MGFFRLPVEIELDQLNERIAELQNQVSKTPKKKKASEETTTKQQLLILNYLGILDEIDLSTKKKAKLFSVILNRDEQNIRSVLTYIDARKIEGSDIKTIENLNAILPLLEDIGLVKPLDKIKADIAKLKID